MKEAWLIRAKWGLSSLQSRIEWAAVEARKKMMTFSALLMKKRVRVLCTLPITTVVRMLIITSLLVQGGDRIQKLRAYFQKLAVLSRVWSRNQSQKILQCCLHKSQTTKRTKRVSKEHIISSISSLEFSEIQFSISRRRMRDQKTVKIVSNTHTFY